MGSGLQFCPSLDRVGPEGPFGVEQAGVAPPSSVLLQAVGSGSWHRAAAGEQRMLHGCPRAAISCGSSALRAAVSPDNALSAAGSALPWVQDPSPAVGRGDRGTVHTGCLHGVLGRVPQSSPSLSFAASLPFVILTLVNSPYKRGFYCNDDSIRYPYKADTITHGLMAGVTITCTVLIVRKLSGLPAEPMSGAETHSP